MTQVWMEAANSKHYKDSVKQPDVPRDAQMHDTDVPISIWVQRPSTRRMRHS